MRREVDHCMHGISDDAGYYRALGVSPRTSDSDLRRAYFMLARQLHPDKRSSGDPDALLAVNEAWHVLKNPSLRAVNGGPFDPRVASVSPRRHFSPRMAAGASSRRSTTGMVRRASMRSPTRPTTTASPTKTNRSGPRTQTQKRERSQAPLLGRRRVPCRGGLPSGTTTTGVGPRLPRGRAARCP